jgi:predicted RND superfamily exporter protein
METWTFTAGAGGALLGALLVVARRPSWIVRWPRAVLLLTVAVSLAATSVLVSLRPLGLRLGIDPSSEPLLPAGDPARDAYQRAVKEFGDDEIYVIALESEDIFSREELEVLRRVTNQIARIAGVRAVKSLADVVSFRYEPEEGWIDVGPFIGEIPTAEAELALLRARAVTDPLYERSLVSRDGRVAAINVSFHKMSDREFIEEDFDGQILRILSETSSGWRRFYVAGRPHLKSRVYEMMVEDLRRLIPAAVAVIALVLGVVSGSLRMVALPLAAVLLATLWTFAGISLLERPLTVLTTLLAPTLIAIGSTYGVHILSRYEVEMRRGGELRDSVLRCLDNMIAPVTISGLTTSVGFASLMITDVPAVFELGSFSVLGILSLTLLSLTALPAALVAFPRLGAARAGNPPSARLLGRGLDVALDAIARFATRSPRAVLVGWLALTAGAAWAIPRIDIDTDYLSYFDARSEIRRDFEAVNRLLSGAVPIFVIMSGSEPGAFREPEALRAMERIQRRLEETPGVSRTVSMVDFVRVLNRVVSEDDPLAERIPDTRSAVADLVFMIPKRDLSRFANVNQSRANILVRTGEVGSAAIRGLVSRIEDILAEDPLPAGIGTVVTGNAVLLGRSADAIAASQPRSVGAAAIAILLLVTGVLRSARLGLVAMIPNAIPIVLFFGALGWGVAPLSLPTSLIACIALGIAIDATAHYLVHYRAERLLGASPSEAVFRSNRGVGRPIALASITLVLGFLVVALSGFATLRQFGLLSAATMLVCAATDLVLLPAVLVRARL